MENKRFWLSVLSVWVLKVVSDWVLHGWWLKSWYETTATYWRPEAEMGQMMWMMWVGSFVFAWAFVWIYSKGIAKVSPWQQAFRYAWAILLVSNIPHIMGMWVTSPYPGELVMRWLAIDIFQAMLCAFVMTWVYKPELTWHSAKR